MDGDAAKADLLEIFIEAIPDRVAQRVQEKLAAASQLKIANKQLYTVKEAAECEARSCSLV